MRAAFDEVAYTLSQRLQGEQAALQLCGPVTNACTQMDDAAIQVVDEARHIGALAGFAARKLDSIHPIEPALDPRIDGFTTAIWFRRTRDSVYAGRRWRRSR